MDARAPAGDLVRAGGPAARLPDADTHALDSASAHIAGRGLMFAFERVCSNAGNACTQARRRQPVADHHMVVIET